MANRNDQIQISPYCFGDELTCVRTAEFAGSFTLILHMVTARGT